LSESRRIAVPSGRATLTSYRIDVPDRRWSVTTSSPCGPVLSTHVDTIVGSGQNQSVFNAPPASPAGVARPSAERPEHRRTGAAVRVGAPPAASGAFSRRPIVTGDRAGAGPVAHECAFLQEVERRVFGRRVRPHDPQPQRINRGARQRRATRVCSAELSRVAFCSAVSGPAEGPADPHVVIGPTGGLLTVADGRGT
jgi:hypothetical protein